MRVNAFIIQNEKILLVEFNNKHGLHYTLPGGEIEANESWIEAVKHEAQEESSVEIKVEPVAFLYG